MQQTVASTVLGRTPPAHAPSLERVLDLARLQVPVGCHMFPRQDIFFFTELFATGVRRSLCRLQLHAVFCEVSVLHAPVQGCSSRTRGKAAGNRGSFVEAGGGKDLAEQGLVAINIGGAGEGKTKETGTERSGGTEGEQGGPTGCEGSNGCRPQRSRHSTGPAASEEANELGGLGTAAATNLKCKDNKSAPLRAHQLWIGAFLSPACEAKSGALVLALVPARSATSIERGNQGGIDSKLRAAPERGSIGDDLDAAIIEAIGVDVEVAHKNIAGNCSPSLSADTGSSTLEREPTGAQDARTGASSAVVTERVDRTAAATSCSVERQGQAKPAEQQSTENRRVQGELVAGRQGGEDPRGERSTLRLKQGEGRSVKHCAEAAGGAIIDSTGSGPLPASSSVDRLVGVCRDNGGLQGQVGEGRRWEASVAEKVDSTGEGAQAAGQ